MCSPRPPTAPRRRISSSWAADDTRAASLDEDGLRRLRELFESMGHVFLVLPNRSQYPLPASSTRSTT